MATLIIAAGCISSPTDPAEQAEPTSVEITPREIMTSGGALGHLAASVRDATGRAVSGATVEWTSSDPSVVIVDTEGTVWTFTEGTATATASFRGRGKSDPQGKAYGHSKSDATVTVTEVSQALPGRVDDLTVTSTTSSSATLQFTEVDDGAGNPSDYVVKFQIAPIDWATAANVTWGSCTAPVRGDGIGTSLTCAVEGLADGTTYDFQVVAVRTNDDVHGELSNVATATTPSSVTASSGTYPNEPAGLSPIAESNFDCRPGGGCEAIGAWRESSNEWKQQHLSVIGDDTGPMSPGSVLRIKFPAQLQDGASPVRFDVWGPSIDSQGGNDYSELYVAYWLKIEGQDYENQRTGTKTHYIAHGSTGRQNHSTMFLDGIFSDQAIMTEMTSSMYIFEDWNADGTDPGGGSRHTMPNVTNRKLVVGKWVRVEQYFKINDIGSDNGVFKTWIDGVLTFDKHDITWRTSAEPKAFYYFQFTPVYGGNAGDVRTRDDYWRIDHLYLSARD